MKVGPGVSRSVLRGREAEWIFFGILRSETDDEENDRRSKRVECGKRSKQTIRHRGCRALDAVCPHPTPPGACRWLQPLFSSGGPDLIASWFVIARCKQTSKKKRPAPSESLLRRASHHRQEIVRQFQPPFHTHTPLLSSHPLPYLGCATAPPCGVRPCPAGRCSALTHVSTFKRLPLALRHSGNQVKKKLCSLPG